jgi:hypothetical protein
MIYLSVPGARNYAILKILFDQKLKMTLSAHFVLSALEVTTKGGKLMSQGYASNGATIFTGVLPKIKQQKCTPRVIRRKKPSKPCGCGGIMSDFYAVTKDGFWVHCPDCKSTGLIPRKGGNNAE